MVFGQLNDYKYIIVPKKFETFKNENQFRTSTLIKYLFTNEGYNAVYEGDFPPDLEQDPCLGLIVNLIDNSSLFATKARLTLTNCSRVVVFETQDGRTKTKDFEQAYREAISEAFGSLRSITYKYEPKETTTEASQGPVTISFKDDVKSLDDPTPTDSLSPESTAEATLTEVQEEKITVPQEVAEDKDILYAQPIEKGYQLVDSTPQVVYVLRSTSSPDVFLVTKDGKSGVVFKDAGKWYLEFDEKGGKAKELKIKF